MAKRSKFEKLGTNEHYSDTHKEDKDTQKTGVFEKIGKRITPKDLKIQNVPEKENPSKKFTFEKDRRSLVLNRKGRTELVENPKKWPFVLAFGVFCLMFAATLLINNGAFSSLSQPAEAGVLTAMFVLVYIAPCVVYIMFCEKPRKTYNMRKFSLSYLPFTIVSLGLLTCVSALQKYYIAYTFSYSESVMTPDMNIWLLIVTSALLPAVCEELFVHGIFQHEVTKYGGGICGILASAIVFAMLHFELQYFFIYLVSGIILSSLTHVTGSVYPAMIVHFLNNVLTILLSGRMAYVAKARIGGTLLMVILGFLCFAFLIILLRMAQNISEGRYITAMGIEKRGQGENVDLQGVDFLVSKESRTPTRLLKVFVNPFMLLIFALFVISIVVF